MLQNPLRIDRRNSSSDEFQPSRLILSVRMMIPTFLFVLDRIESASIFVDASLAQESLAFQRTSVDPDVLSADEGL